MSRKKPGSNYIIIIGCGRLGAHLADRMSKAGDSVVIIDRDKNSFIRLSQDFSGFTIEGEAMELSMLKQAKVEAADALVAVTGNDNINLSVVQIADKLFGVSHTIARVKDEEKENYFSGCGIHVVSPVSLLSTLLTRIVSNPVKNGEKA